MRNTMIITNSSRTKLHIRSGNDNDWSFLMNRISNRAFMWNTRVWFGICCIEFIHDLLWRPHRIICMNNFAKKYSIPGNLNNRFWFSCFLNRDFLPWSRTMRLLVNGYRNYSPDFQNCKIYIRPLLFKRLAVIVFVRNMLLVS